MEKLHYLLSKAVKNISNKRTLTVLFAFVLSVFVLSAPQQASALTQKQSAMKAYKTFLAKSKISWGTVSVKASKCKFAVAYIDNNSVPELIVYSPEPSQAAGYARLYTYSSKKVKLVSSLRGATVGSNSSYVFNYYKKKGIFVDTSFSAGSEGYHYTKLSGTKATRKVTSGYSYLTGKWSYRNDSTNKAITKTKFNSLLKSLKGSASKTKAAFHSNTSANRTKYLK